MPAAPGWSAGRRCRRRPRSGASRRAWGQHPSCTSMPTSSRTNSGLPPVEVGSRRSSSSGNRSLPSTRPANSAVAPASSLRSRTALGDPAADGDQIGPVSRSSGRASAIIRTGAPRTHSARCSMKSSSRLSAHWMSSKISTSGSPAASTSTKRRSAQNVSSTEPGTPDVMPVGRAACGLVRRCRRGSPLQVAGTQHLHDRSQRRAALHRAANVEHPRAGQGSREFAASRVLPTPGSPVTVTRRRPDAATALSKTLRGRCNSSPRPTRGDRLGGRRAETIDIPARGLPAPT